MKSHISTVFNFLFGPRIEKKKVLAVHEESIGDLLNKLSVMEKLDGSDLSCHFCGRKVTKENMQCIFKRNNKLAFCCDELECYVNAVEMMKAQSEE